MKAVFGMSTPWTGSAVRVERRRTPAVIVLAGINNSDIVDAALTDTALHEAVVLRFEPGCSAPCDAVLWRLETTSGESLGQPGQLRRHWHRPPYAMTIRLVRYLPGDTTPWILDEGTIGTRGSYATFTAAAERLAMRFVRDAALGRSRGASTMSAAAAPCGLPGWLGFLAAKWHQRLTTEWWSLGTSPVSLTRLISDGGLGDIHWFNPEPGPRYLADPFPWPGSGRILCEDMPVTDGIGRIVAVAPQPDGTLGPPGIVLEDGFHHSYPCTYAEGGAVYCVPEAVQRGGTRIFRLDENGVLSAVCNVAPHARLADPTLFRWGGSYWLGCTDLDLGGHDNLCFLHAPSLAGPWVPHARWPVKIDVRGARCAGAVLFADGKPIRPGQDCAATYGAAVVLHAIHTLTETEFREDPVAVLRPVRTGPFPDGLHTLVHDGEKFWVDGKRFVFSLAALRCKVFGRASRMLATGKVN